MSPVWRPDTSTPSSRAQDPPHYAVVDTTFSTVDMGAIAVDTLRGLGVPDARIHRVTVPGFKDLAVACKRLIEQGCAIAVACGMPGPEPIDKQCGHEASLAIGDAQLMTSTHILEVFVHMDEARTDAELIAICRNRVAEHAVNAYWLVERPQELVKRAGTGQRQGFADVGAADPRKAEASHLRPAGAVRASDAGAAGTDAGARKAPRQPSGRRAAKPARAAGRRRR